MTVRSQRQRRSTEHVQELRLCGYERPASESVRAAAREGKALCFCGILQPVQFRERRDRLGADDIRAQSFRSEWQSSIRKSERFEWNLYYRKHTPHDSVSGATGSASGVLRGGFCPTAKRHENIAERVSAEYCERMDFAAKRRQNLAHGVSPGSMES